MNNYYTDPHWETVYICSVCGEHSSTKSKKCPFCHHEMQNYEGSITLCENSNKNKCGEFIAQIIEIFENFLDDKGIVIDNPERDEDHDPTELKANIYGSDYGELQTEIEDLLNYCKVLL